MELYKDKPEAAKPAEGAAKNKLDEWL
jgi:hypothetical protein